MMPKLLAALDFRSNNGAHRPLIDALERVRAAEGEGRQYFGYDEVPIEGVVRPKWRDIVIEEAPDGGTRINRIETAELREGHRSSTGDDCDQGGGDPPRFGARLDVAVHGPGRSDPEPRRRQLRRRRGRLSPSLPRPRCNRRQGVA
jgi:hypothetical protein